MDTATALAQPYPEQEISIIAALTPDRVIGKDNKLPWRLPSDLRRFKKLTTGHPVIMGRKTRESIGRPLDGRTNIVVTRQPDYEASGAIIVSSIEEALAVAFRADGSDEIFFIGGGDIFASAIHIATKAYLTKVCAPIRGDVWFPLSWNPHHWSRTNHDCTELPDGDGYPSRFEVYQRIR